MRNLPAALRGPMVWLLEGPWPILYISLMDSMLMYFCVKKQSFTGYPNRLTDVFLALEKI
jgi:hypothetical protein